ncbi:MAG: hypothetical protein M3077_08345 [Candidatus Dormibacteraeota bacterium]|nr:hypothetical protein [Candidatus Dormibacteraeota bacterium]
MMEGATRLKFSEVFARRLGDHLRAIPQHLDINTDKDFGRTMMQLTFSTSRQNYASLLASLESDHVVPAAQLARALLEESIRWEWLSDDIEKRSPVLISALQRNMQLIMQECERIGADATPFLNPSPFFSLKSPEPTPVASGFPGYDRMLDEIQVKLKGMDLPITVNLRSLYAMYRVLSQLSHTTILGMISTVQPANDADLSVGQALSIPMRALVVHAGAASVVNVSTYTVHAFADHDPDRYNSWVREARRLGERIARLIGSVHGLIAFR